MEPSSNENELEVEGNTTIAELKDIYVPGQLTVVEDAVFVQGIVVGNDAAGNFPGSLIIQDATAGIEVLIDTANASELYPLGQELTIDCQDLVLGKSDGVIQLGGAVDFTERIYPGEIVPQPAPKVRDINELRGEDISTLVRLETVEFASSELGLPYADAAGQQTINRVVKDCDGNTILLRTSGSADFASELLPEGNGSIVAVYSVSGNTDQLFIRDTDDVDLTGNRCTPDIEEEELISIRALRDAFEDGASWAPDNRKIRGVVLSDRTSGNFQSREMILQDETAGIVVRFQDDHNFSLGEEVEVVVSGQELSEFERLLQLNGVNLSRASFQGMGSATPRIATVNDVLENGERWESTLVQLSNVTISGSNTFGFITTVSDGTEMIDMFTSPGADFANAALPQEPVDTMFAIVSQYSEGNGPADQGYQLKIRNLEDIHLEDGGSGDPEQVGLAELRTLFEGGASAAPSDRFVRGIVISDKNAGNTTDRNLFLQDESGGIVLRFNESHPFSLGEEIEVDVSGAELIEYRGLLQVNNLPYDNAFSMGNGTLPEPREATVAEILDNAEVWESTLVKVSDISFMGGGDFGGTKTLSDGTGEIVTFIRIDASFASESVPEGSFTLTAIVSEFDETQLTIRNLNDIEP